MSSVDSHREAKVIKGSDSHDHYDDNHSGGSFSRLMRRVYSLEDLLKKLRWERSAVQAETKEEICQSDGEECGFRMPLHYPTFSKADYESMEEWRLDYLFHYYGLDVTGDAEYKRQYAIGAFLWPDQCP